MLAPLLSCHPPPSSNAWRRNWRLPAVRRISLGADPDRAHSVYRRLARAVYPDLRPAEQQRATDVFKSLGAWWALARQRLEQGIYGTPATSREPLTLVASSGRTITLGDLWSSR